MSPSYDGGRHWIGFAPEAEPGVAEDEVTTFLATETVSMNPNPSPIERKAQLTTARRLPSRRGGIKPDGKTTAEIHASQPQPWYWLAGAVASTQPDIATAPTVWNHRITDGGDPISLTAEADKVYTKSKQAGVKLDKATLKLTTGEIASVDLSWFGLTHDDDPDITSVPAFPTDLMTTVAMIVKIAGERDFRVNDVELTYDNSLEQLPVLEDAEGAPHVVRRKEAMKLTGKFKFIDFPAEQLAKIRAADTFELVVDLLGPVITGEYRELLSHTWPACQYTGGLDAEAAAVVITGDADFEAFYDVTTAEQFVIESVNTVASIIE